MGPSWQRVTHFPPPALFSPYCAHLLLPPDPFSRRCIVALEHKHHPPTRQILSALELPRRYSRQSSLSFPLLLPTLSIHAATQPLRWAERERRRGARAPWLAGATRRSRGARSTGDDRALYGESKLGMMSEGEAMLDLAYAAAIVAVRSQGAGDGGTPIEERARARPTTALCDEDGARPLQPARVTARGHCGRPRVAVRSWARAGGRTEEHWLKRAVANVSGSSSQKKIHGAQWNTTKKRRLLDRNRGPNGGALSPYFLSRGFPKDAQR